MVKTLVLSDQMRLTPQIAYKLLNKRNVMNKLLLFSVFSILTLNVMAQEKVVQTAGRDQLGTFAPSLRNLMTMFSLEKFGAALTNSVCVTCSLVTLPPLSVWESRTIRSFIIIQSAEKERIHPHGDREISLI